MATLREIRKQIRSVSNIKKITQAMEMVAGSRLRKAQMNAEIAHHYSNKLKDIILNLVHATDDFDYPLSKKRPVKKIGVIIVTSDKGLCGSYNNKVIVAAEQFLKTHAEKNPELILFGRKGIDYFSRRKWPIRIQRQDWGGKISYSEIKQITEEAMSFFLHGEMDEIWVIYTHYISILTRKIVVEKFLNIEKPTIETYLDSGIYIFEPDAETILSDLLPRYCITKIQTILGEAYASELAARVLSMRAATKNADELTESLVLVRNKVRQAGITREMLEIISCAEILNASS